KSMAYKQSQETLGVALTEAGYGNWVPAVKLLTLGIAAGWGIESLTSILYGGEPDDEDRSKLATYLGYMGESLGLIEEPFRIVGQARSNRLISALTPAAVSDVGKMADILIETGQQAAKGEIDAARTARRVTRLASGGKTVDHMLTSFGVSDAP